MQSYSEIEIKINTELKATPIYIFFTTALDLEEGSDEEIEYLNTCIENFLLKHKLNYKKLESYRFYISKPEKELTFDYNPFEIKLSFEDYHVFREILSNPSINGLVEGDIFNSADSVKLIQKAITEAEIEAKAKAEYLNLSLGKIKKVEEIGNTSEWTVGPPLSYDYNHFDQKLFGEYRIIFETFEK